VIPERIIFVCRGITVLNFFLSRIESILKFIEIFLHDFAFNAT